jgi:hypothetical protein
VGEREERERERERKRNRKTISPPKIKLRFKTGAINGRKKVFIEMD